MDERGFDHDDVLQCLRRGSAYGPEQHGAGERSNVLHAGLHIRVSVAGLERCAGDWPALDSITVATVIRTD